MEWLLPAFIIAIILGIISRSGYFGETFTKGTGFLSSLLLFISIVTWLINRREINYSTSKENKISIYANAKLSSILKTVQKDSKVKGICKWKASVKIKIGEEIGFVRNKDVENVDIENLANLPACSTR